MSAKEHPAIRAVLNAGVPRGEVTEVSASGVTVAQSNRPSDELFRYAPGTEVFVLTADDVLALVPGGAL